ncbi:MAG: hydrolase [Rhizobiales bacterium 65-9]|nr:HAD family hydrolase [Hyphomicrobiales bacterium]OJY34776.1 MAG: hydrolase [Rhizobiales bacterium 65-9]
MLMIFDCDGVLVDSEHLACAVEAEYLTSLGMPFTVEDVARRFVGLNMRDMIAALTSEFGARVPAEFQDELRRRTTARLQAELTAIEGVREAIEAISLPRCVASSSSPARIASSLTTAKLIDLFEPSHLFSSTMVARGKPAPDVFLHAAREMGVGAERCVVIEDSIPGVTAAIAAGMRVIGFTGGTHVRDKAAHGAALRAVGAHRIADHMREAPALVGAFAA